uniref:Uncharacterized protein n=1 Tax=Anguilla anguilla TaxID=7936 RepID=A0A0E9QQY3_ANGAN
MPDLTQSCQLTQKKQSNTN